MLPVIRVQAEVAGHSPLRQRREDGAQSPQPLRQGLQQRPVVVPPPLFDLLKIRVAQNVFRLLVAPIEVEDLPEHPLRPPERLHAVGLQILPPQRQMLLMGLAAGGGKDAAEFDRKASAGDLQPLPEAARRVIAEGVQTAVG